MLTPSGTWILISCRRALSSASSSMSLLWMRISQWSQVSEPPPQGDFLTGTLSLFVGSGMGPVIAVPVRSAICLIWLQTFSMFSMLGENSRIRAFCVIQTTLVDCPVGCKSIKAHVYIPYR